MEVSAIGRRPEHVGDGLEAFTLEGSREMHTQHAGTTQAPGGSERTHRGTLSAAPHTHTISLPPQALLKQKTYSISAGVGKQVSLELFLVISCHG